MPNRESDADEGGAATPGLDRLLAALEDCVEDGRVDAERAAAAVAAAEFAPSELARLCRFEADRYTRQRLARTDEFEVLLICWEPGHETRVHDHCGQSGWVRVLEGTIEETRFDFTPLDGVEVPDGCSPAACRLREVERHVVAASHAVAPVDRERAIHRLRNPGDRGERAVSLHVYSKPHDSCMTYDLESRTSERVELVAD